MQIAISGASGFVGRHLTKVLEASGHSVLRLGRSAKGPGQRQWDPMAGPPDLKTDPPLDAVIHLAGEPVSQRWSQKVKDRIRDSRVIGTRHMVEAIRNLAVKPKVLVNGSATGWYGDGGDRVLDESEAAGNGFLADVCREWEAEADAAAKLGVRVVKIRTGIALGPDGGALAKMLLPFRLGLGAKLGDGKQWMSWIHIDDLTGMMQFAAENEKASGAWNGVAPAPATNAAFTKELAAALHRPAIFTAPEFLVKLGAGEMAQIVFASQRCSPKAPQAAGFEFRYPELGSALRAVVS